MTEPIDNPATPDADNDDSVQVLADAGEPPVPPEGDDVRVQADVAAENEDDGKGYDEDTADVRELPEVEDDGQDDADPNADAEDDGDDGAEAEPDDPFAVEPVEGAVNPVTGQPL